MPVDYKAILRKLLRDDPSFIRYRGTPEEGRNALSNPIEPPPEGEVEVEELPRTVIDVEASQRPKKKKPAVRVRPSRGEGVVDETASIPGNVAGDGVVEGSGPALEGALARQQQFNQAIVDDEQLGLPGEDKLSPHRKRRFPFPKRK